MAIDNPLPIDTKVMTMLGLGIIVGFILEAKNNGWKYQVQFTSLVFGESSKFWIFEENVRKASWLEVLLYG